MFPFWNPLHFGMNPEWNNLFTFLTHFLSFNWHFPSSAGSAVPVCCETVEHSVHETYLTTYKKNITSEKGRWKLKTEYRFLNFYQNQRYKSCLKWVQKYRNMFLPNYWRKKRRKVVKFRFKFRKQEFGRKTKQSLLKLWNVKCH